LAKEAADKIGVEVKHHGRDDTHEPERDGTYTDIGTVEERGNIPVPK
jgi:hypothetical protein